jgi:hypothetical protein
MDSGTETRLISEHLGFSLRIPTLSSFRIRSSPAERTLATRTRKKKQVEKRLNACLNTAQNTQDDLSTFSGQTLLGTVLF